MTSSSPRNQFQITPKRSPFENLVETPERYQDPEAPAQPNKEQYRRGGSLYDKSSFQPDRGAEKAITQLENFLDKETGGWTKAQDYLFEQWKIGAKSRADYQLKVDNYLSSAKNAFEAGIKNAKVTKEFTSKKEYELAKENRLNDPWTNFYYYDSLAQEKGKTAAIDLQASIVKDLNFLAGLPETEVGHELQKRANAILKGFEHIPQAAVAARIEPFLAAVTTNAKIKVANHRRLLGDITDQETFNSQTRSSLLSASKLIKVSGESEATIKELQNSLIAPRTWAENVRGYSGREITDMYGEFIKNGGLYVDADGDGINDIGQHIDNSILFKAFEGIKIDGVSVLDLHTTEGDSIRKLLEQAQTNAVTISERISNAKVKRRERTLNEFKDKLIINSREWRLANPNPTEKEIEAQRIKLVQAINDFYTQDGGNDARQMTEKDVTTFIESMLPWTGVLDKTPPKIKAEILKEANRLVANGATEIPVSLMAEMRNSNGNLYDVYTDVLGIFDKANTKAVTDRNTTQKNLVINDLKNIKLQVSESLATSNPRILELLNSGNQNNIASAKRYLKTVETNIFPILERYLPQALNEAYSAEVDAGHDINDPKVQARVFDKALKSVLSSPLLADVDSWLQPEGKNQFSLREVPNIGEVILGYDGDIDFSGSYQPSSPHKININFSDITGETAALYLNTHFDGDRAGYEKYLRKTFVLPESDIKAWSQVFSLAAQNQPIPTDLITKEMRTRLHNMSTVASGGVVKPWEVLKRSLNLYEGNTALNTRGLKPEDYQTIMNNMGSLSHSVDVTQVDADAINTTSVTATPMSRLIYDGSEYAVDVALTKGASQQFSNDVGSPVQGTVVFVGNDDRHGNYVIIRANSGTDFNQKGDLIKISNLASISVKEGDNLGRGVLIGLQGDDSALNSTEGRSTTGSDIEAGHINIQVLQPGENVDPNNDSQYSQAYQNKFVKGMFLSLYTGDTTNSGNGPITYVNPSDFTTPVDINLNALNDLLKQNGNFNNVSMRTGKVVFRDVPVEKSGIKTNALTQYGIVETEDGNLVSATDSSVNESGTVREWSIDGGKTWTTTKPSQQAIDRGFALIDKNSKEIDLSLFPGGVKIEYGDNGEITNIEFGYDPSDREYPPG